MEYHSALTVYNSPAFLKFTVDSITIESNRKLIDANYRPKLNAFADAGINSISLTDLQKKIGYSVGANFSIPLYDGHQRKLEYNRLQLAEQTRKDYRDFYNSQVIIRLQQLDAEKLANESILQKLKNEQHEIETLLAMNREDLNHGIISVTDYIVNLRRFIQLKSELNAVEVRTFIVINEYNYITW
jgi:outer membrane protein TolC